MKKTLEAIETELGEAREALSNVEGREAEVYSRIVGYYRSVRNWNKGKREEYGERKLFNPSSPGEENSADSNAVSEAVCESCRVEQPKTEPVDAGMAGSLQVIQPTETIQADAQNTRILLFVQPGCPACPAAKEEAAKLSSSAGVRLETIDAATKEGFDEAKKYGILATPTVILLRGDAELSRAEDKTGIDSMKMLLTQPLKAAA